MAQPTNAEELHTAWRALAVSPDNADGWRTIPIASDMTARIRAGRHFPGNEEAILVGFAGIQLPPAATLPQGRGFQVSAVDVGDRGTDIKWLSLARLATASVDMFAAMAADVLTSLRVLRGAAEDILLQSFLARIAAWQKFMEHGGPAALSPEGEIGLFGELLMVRDLLDIPVAAATVIHAWHGPFGSAQDFAIGTGAIEVKTTDSASSFPAFIGSIDQLDDSLFRPLALAAFHIALSNTGLSLIDLSDEIASRLIRDPPLQELFRSLLIRAGLLAIHRPLYTRRFLKTRTLLYAVDSGFPRLIRRNVPTAIRSVKYELDLNSISSASTELSDILIACGVN